jgi:hypothetical protein
MGEGINVIEDDSLWAERANDWDLREAEGLEAYDEFLVSTPQDESPEMVVDTLGTNGKPPILEGYVEPFLDDISNEPVPAAEQ